MLCKWLIFFSILWLSLLSFMAVPQRAFAQVSEIEVNALFRDKALVIIDGQHHMMSVNDEINGVTLLGANSYVARLQVEGKVYELGVSQQVSVDEQSSTVVEIFVPQNPEGDYVLQVEVESSVTQMRIDPKLPYIMMSLPEAQRLGVDYRNGEQIEIVTVQGDVVGWRVKLRRVSVEGITFNDLDGVVLGSNSPNMARLGGSFLSRVRLQQANGGLVLRSMPSDH